MTSCCIIFCLTKYIKYVQIGREYTIKVKRKLHIYQMSKIFKVNSILHTWGRGPFDLDYNFIFISIPQKYEKSPECLKNLVTEVLDGLVDKRFTYGKDSTSSIKYIVHKKDRKTVVFSFDVALIREGGRVKLIHDKKQGVFIWNQIRDSGDLDKKVATIKKGGCWKKVRDDYRDLKNGYLKKGDMNHPSFIVYIQSVNQVYRAMKTGN